MKQTYSLKIEFKESDGNETCGIAGEFTFLEIKRMIAMKICGGPDNIKLGAARTILEAHANLVAREEQAEVIRDLEVRLEQIAAGGLQSLPAAEVIDAEVEPVETEAAERAQKELF